MSDRSREFPDRPNLRFLKVEAKRRLSAGEFPTLHEAQLAIAREHGLPSWTALKEFIDTARPPAWHALTQVRWLLSRFHDAGAEGWTAPADDELRAHVTERYLALVPPDTLSGTLGRVAGRLREDLVVTRETPSGVRAQVADLRIEAAVEAEPPYRLTGLRMYPVGERVSDPRVAAPPVRSSGTVPEPVARIAAESFAELGLTGLVLAGSASGDGDAVWALAQGWADVDAREVLRPDHRFPAYGITKLVTATAVLRLVADGRIGLDDPADRHLRAIRLADEAVTVRELLTHTGGVDGPEEMFTDTVPDPVSVLGPVVACGGVRGVFAPSNGGYAVLGELIAEVTGASYPDAAARLVLEPLGMRRSWFPASAPRGDVVSGHHLGDDGVFAPESLRLCVLPAAAGLWTTAADLVRLGRGRSALLPADLSAEALRPHAGPDGPGAKAGFGWLVNPAKGVAGHPGAGPGAAASLIVRPGDGQVSVALTNRLVPIEPVNARLVRPIA